MCGIVGVFDLKVDSQDKNAGIGTIQKATSPWT